MSYLAVGTIDCTKAGPFDVLSCVQAQVAEKKAADEAKARLVAANIAATKDAAARRAEIEASRARLGIVTEKTQGTVSSYRPPGAPPPSVEQEGTILGMPKMTAIVVLGGLAAFGAFMVIKKKKGAKKP